MNDQQKYGDKYNYEVAALLKTSCYEFAPGITFDFRKFNFNAAPNPFPPVATLFNQEISIDLIISTSDIEYLCECKSSDSLKHFGVDSREFKESLLEFIALESYRIRQPRDVKYMLITNMQTRKLEKEVHDLRRNSDGMQNYSVELQKQGKRKWSGFDSEINAKDIVAALGNLLLIQIEKGRLGEVSKERHFQEALIEIVRDVERRNPKVVPIVFATRAHLRMELNIKEDNYLEKRKLGYNVEVSSNILDQIVAYENSLKGDIVKATVKELPFLGECQVNKTQKISIDKAAKLLTETLNDLVEERLESLSYIAIFFPGFFDMYFLRTNWASKLVDRHEDPSTGRYSLISRNEVPMSIPPYVSILLITETRRLLNATIVDLNLIDQSTDDIASFS